MFKLSATRADFWAAKIEGNRKRDARALKELSSAGWRTFVLWECDLRGPARRSLEVVIDEVFAWLTEGGARMRREVLDRGERAVWVWLSESEVSTQLTKHQLNASWAKPRALGQSAET